MYVASKQRFMSLQRADLEKINKKELLQIARYGRRTINTYIRNVEKNVGILPLKELRMFDIQTLRIPLITSTDSKEELISQIEGMQLDWENEALSLPTARDINQKVQDIIDNSTLSFDDYMNADFSSVSWIDVLMKMGYSSDDTKEILEERDWGTNKFDYLYYAIQKIEERKAHKEKLGVRD